MKPVLSVRRLVVAAVAGAVASSALLVAGFPRVEAQIDQGGYEGFQPHQSGKCFWVRCSPNSSSEWWAYIDGEYEFADSSNTTSNPWTISATYVNAGNYASYSAWKDWVLSLSETQGKTIIFQIHAVEEEVVAND